LGLLKFSYINHKSHGSKYFDFAKRNLNIWYKVANFPLFSQGFSLL
jgi:hypothetical protein